MGVYDDTGTRKDAEDFRQINKDATILMSTYRKDTKDSQV